MAECDDLSAQSTSMLTIIVVIHDMRREAVRTLYSLSADYQHDVPASDYDVVVVENGSSDPLTVGEVAQFGENFSYVFIEDASPSPAAAINQAARTATTPFIGVMIDGARMASPGMIRLALDALTSFEQPVVATIGFHLGPDVQWRSVQHGYDAATEDEILEKIGWRENGYGLFEISALAGASTSGWLGPLFESNLIFLATEQFRALGGYDERFDLPGGGLVNMDFYRRASGLPNSKLVTLLGEATFHQVHGGITTNAAPAKRARDLKQFHAQYKSIRGSQFEPPGGRTLLFGTPVPESIDTLPTGPGWALRTTPRRRTRPRRIASAVARRAGSLRSRVSGRRAASRPRVSYLDLLDVAHDVLRPELYVEIGCATGRSLARARSSSIAVDPAFTVTEATRSHCRFFRETSDDFFGRANVADIFGRPIDLAFVDGMHRVEFALRDFMNLERHSSPAGVILVDDILPKNMAWTARERDGKHWTGDVYRLLAVLKIHRPDLDIAVYDIDSKGLAVISGLDPSSRRLSEAYDEIIADLDGGAHVLTSARQLRRRSAPRDPSSLAVHLRQIKANASRTSQSESLASRHLELTKKALLNELHLDHELRLTYLKKCLSGEQEFDPARFHNLRELESERFEELAEARRIGKFDGGLSNVGAGHTMIGRLRLDSLHDCLDVVTRAEVPGDLMECGVWRGGACILMAEYLKTHGMTGRRVIVADSFRGLPKPYDPRDARLDLSAEKYPQLAVSLDEVKNNFRSYDLLDEHVVFHDGWFADTLADTPTDRLALLRLDADLYSSTTECLDALYDRVSDGGIVIVDDYGALAACRQAVGDFFERRNEPMPDLTTIDWTGVYWTKKAFEGGRG